MTACCPAALLMSVNKTGILSSHALPKSNLSRVSGGRGGEKWRMKETGQGEKVREEFMIESQREKTGKERKDSVGFEPRTLIPVV